MREPTPCPRCKTIVMPHDLTCTGCGAPRPLAAGSRAAELTRSALEDSLLSTFAGQALVGLAAAIGVSTTGEEPRATEARLVAERAWDLAEAVVAEWKRRKERGA